MPPQPGHGTLPAGYGSLRASTADRERAVDVLKAAFAEGRLTQDECVQRAGQAYTARTYAELAALTADLPAGSLISPAGGYPVPPPSRPVNKLAVASLLIALMPVLPMLAVFTGLIAHAQIQERGERGAALATAGMLIGGLVSLLFLFYGLHD